MDPLVVLLVVLLALAVGAIALLLAERQRLLAARHLAEARLADQERSREGFRSLASEVLQSSNEEFLRLAKEAMAAGRAETVAEVERRKGALDELVRPIQEALVRTHEELRRVGQGQTGLGEQVKRMAGAHQELRAEAAKLSQALRKPNVRGRYGEVQLQRVVELAGMRAYCDFTVQGSLRDEADAMQRPDMVVRLPNGRRIAVDAKTSIDAYLEALDASTPEEAEALLERYADNVLEQARKLASKQYWRHFDESPELVVMFIPGDQLVDAALERRPKLIDWAAEHDIVLASPSTLIGLLRAVHVGWRERNLTESAEELFRLGQELHGRAARVMERAAKIGLSLDQARKSYNEFVGSVQSRLVPTLRRFEERGARSSRELVEPLEIEGELRSLPQGLFEDFEDGDGDEDAGGRDASPGAGEEQDAPSALPRR